MFNFIYFATTDKELETGDISIGIYRLCLKDRLSMLFPRPIFVIFSFCVCLYPCMIQCFPFPLLRPYLHICTFYADNHQITLLNSCSLDTSCEGTEIPFWVYNANVNAR